MLLPTATRARWAANARAAGGAIANGWRATVAAARRYWPPVRHALWVAICGIGRLLRALGVWAWQELIAPVLKYLWQQLTGTPTGRKVLALSTVIAWAALDWEGFIALIREIFPILVTVGGLLLVAKHLKRSFKSSGKGKKKK